MTPHGAHEFSHGCCSCFLVVEQEQSNICVRFSTHKNHDHRRCTASSDLSPHNLRLCSAVFIMFRAEIVAAATGAARRTPPPPKSRSRGARSTSPFSLSHFVSVALKGVSTCMELYLLGWRSRAKPNDKFVRAPTNSSMSGNSRSLPRLYGLTTPRLISRASLAGMSARGLAGSPANSNLPASFSPPSSPRLRGASKRRWF